MTEAIAVVAIVAVLGTTVSNILWLRALKFLVNTAVSRGPQELAVREQIAKTDERPKPKGDPRPRPEGL